jgi:predicted ATPase
MKSETTKREADEPKESKQLDFDLQVTNFGPITSGKISLKPFTVFIGPNNSGKSYAAMMINAILEAVRVALPAHWPSIRRRAVTPKMVWSSSSNFPKRIFLEKRDNEILVDNEKINKIAGSMAMELFQHSFKETIETSFGCPLEDLVKSEKQLFAINIVFGEYAIELIGNRSHENFVVKKYPSPPVEIQVAVTDDDFISVNPDNIQNEILVRFPRQFISEMDQEYGAKGVVASVAQELSKRFLNQLYLPADYLPAGRSGILQVYREVAASLIQSAHRAGLEEHRIAKLSGVAVNLISSLIDLPLKKGPFFELSKTFEEELIGGQIVVFRAETQDIKYQFRNSQLPLHRSSSTVTELAPLFLYLKYYITPGSVLIIEEPEAHLHPYNIRLLAKWLVRLRREGVNLILTTHSQYLLEQLSNFIMLQRVSATKRKEKYGYDKNDFLKPEEVGVFFFKPDKRTDGFKIKTVPVDAIDGIAEEGFAEVHDGLYEEAIRLERDLMPKGQKCD